VVVEPLAGGGRRAGNRPAIKSGGSRPRTEARNPSKQAAGGGWRDGARKAAVKLDGNILGK
jgi:hypothetical protein